VGKDAVLVVVEPRPEICGVLHLDVTGRCADRGLSVSGWARGKGIGRLLFERARQLASAHGVTIFRLEAPEQSLKRWPLSARQAEGRTQPHHPSTMIDRGVSRRIAAP
jgi:GNAT superfamily N-acetyltransferase